MAIIPQNFEEWKICIEQKCEIPLTRQFAEQRLAIYKNEKLPETQRFLTRYGADHLQHIIAWFTRVVEEKKNELSV